MVLGPNFSADRNFRDIHIQHSLSVFTHTGTCTHTHTSVCTPPPHTYTQAYVCPQHTHAYTHTHTHSGVCTTLHTHTHTHTDEECTCWRKVTTEGVEITTVLTENHFFLYAWFFFLVDCERSPSHGLYDLNDWLVTCVTPQLQQFPFLKKVQSV